MKAFLPGIEKGIKQGIKQEKEQIAIELLRLGLDINSIQKATRLSLEHIKKLKQNLNL